MGSNVYVIGESLQVDDWKMNYRVPLDAVYLLSCGFGVRIPDGAPKPGPEP